MQGTQCDAVPHTEVVDGHYIQPLILPCLDIEPLVPYVIQQTFLAWATGITLRTRHIDYSRGRYEWGSTTCYRKIIWFKPLSQEKENESNGGDISLGIDRPGLEAHRQRHRLSFNTEKNMTNGDTV